MTLNLSTLPIGTRLRTRDGRSARLLATDLKSDWPIVVASANDAGNEEILDTYLPSGRYLNDEDGDGNLYARDIVSVEAAPRAMLDVGRK